MFLRVSVDLYSDHPFCMAKSNPYACVDIFIFSIKTSLHMFFVCPCRYHWESQTDSTFLLRFNAWLFNFCAIWQSRSHIKIATINILTFCCCSRHYLLCTQVSTTLPCHKKCIRFKVNWSPSPSLL